MVFDSFEFFVFLPAVWMLYWSLGRWRSVQNVLLLAASYVFYGWFDWRFLLLLGFTSLFAWVLGLVEERRWERRPSRIVLASSLAVNLGVLSFFCYFNFFIAQTARVLNELGIASNLTSLKVILPVGLSFYTFQAIGYSFDVYRRQVRPSRDPVAFFLFLGFFPQLVAGPIERASNLLRQIETPRAFSRPQAVGGARQMLWGLVKKVFVADNCAVVADAILNGGATANGLGVLLGVFFYTIQIYADFSGYSDIAIGSARLFGFELKANFRYPYFARTVADFWRRWHMSLMTWFRDYLYIPLGGSRCSTAKRIRNTFIVFLVSGLWHGADWTFVLWGALHAVFFLPLLLSPKSRDRNAPVLTFLLVMFGWLFFRAPDLLTAADWLSALFNPLTYGASIGKLPRELWTASVATGLMTAVEWLNREEPFGLARLPRSRPVRWTAYVAATWLMLFFKPDTTGGFLYFQF